MNITIANNMPSNFPIPQLFRSSKTYIIMEIFYNGAHTFC